MRTFLLCVLLWSPCHAIEAADLQPDWPQWRGPLRDGHASPAEPALGRLPAEPKVIWKVRAGPGLSSPVVAGRTVIHFDAVDGRETLHNLDAATGEKRWSRAIDETFRDSQGPEGPRCTPVIDEDRVYAVSCRGQLDCLRLADGEKLWGVNFQDFGVVFVGEKGNTPGAARHGNNGSPLVHGGRLYVCVGGPDGAGIVCFDKRSGRVLWKSQNDAAAYVPPIIGRWAGREQLICYTAEGLIGLDPAEGTLFWRVPIKTAFARHVTAPVWDGDLVVVSSHQAGMIGTRLTPAQKGAAAEQAWLSKEAAMNFSSPVAVGGFLYGLGPRKNLICVEIATGRVAWSEEGVIQTSADRAYAGFLAVRSNLLALTDEGLLVLFAASPEKFQELGRAQVCGANWCNPAYAGGRLYLRDGIKGAGDLLCLELAGGPGQ